MHRTRAYIAALLAFALAFGTAGSALAATTQELEFHRSKATSARKQAAAASTLARKLQDETTRLDAQVDSLQAEADSLNPKISTATARTERLLAEVAALRSRIVQKQATITETTARYTREQELLSARVESTYKQGDWFYYDLLLGSSDLGDFITRTELVQRVIRYNNDMAAQLADTRDQLQRAKIELDRSLEMVNIMRKEAEAVESELKNLRGLRQAKVNQQQAVLNQKSDLMAENTANAVRLLAIAKAEEAEADRVAAILRGRGSGSGVYNGVMQWPVDGGYVSSPFGWRIHPIFKTRRLHRGLDIAAGLGTDVYAAGAGTVIKTDYGWGGGYGNRIWIDHGNGVVTTYNHLQTGSFEVDSGTTVGKGDVIAGVGSTGFSTGPHLHFEVWVNGDAKNPMTYLR